jgi:hypothetical protein
MTLEKDLQTIYTNPSNPASFSSPQKLYLQARKQYPKLKLSVVKRWLESQNTYTLHKQVRTKFKHRKTLARGIRYQYQIDLVDFQKLKKWNRQNRYLLTAIDIFSRRAAVEPIINKSGEVVLKALKKIFQKLGKPTYLQSDQGKEFFNYHVQKYLKSINVHHFFTASDQKSSICERFNRTLQDKMYKYFTEKSTFAYLPVVQKIVTAYNNTIHSSINIAPSKVTKKNEKDIWQYQYGKYLNQVPLKFKFKINESVRISKSSRTFKKGYLPKFQSEYFHIADKLSTMPPVYKLIDADGEILKGVFYENELQLARPN